MHYDVIVAGAGPAGSSAAALLAREGLSVLLLEKAKHPRHKSCGGGLSARLLPFLDNDVRTLIEQTVSHLSFRFKEKEVTFSSERPVAYLVRRTRFDAYLADRAGAAGAEVREECPVLRWRERPEGVEVESRFGKATASFLIAADGGNSRIARQMHPQWEKALAFSLESEIPRAGAFDAGKATWEERYENAVFIDLTLPRGYGWIFPKADQAAIGVAGFRGKEKRPQQCYQDFLKRNALSPSVLPPPHGCALPIYRRPGLPLTKGHALLVGDAGCLIDPLFGEGIYYAVRSGQLAARAVIAALKKGAPIQSYDDEIRKRFYPEFQVAAKIAYWVYAFPWLFLEANRRHPNAMELYLGVLRGERSYVEFWSKVRWEFFKRWNPFRRFRRSSAASSPP